MKTAIRAALAALVAGTTVLAAPAQAATITQKTGVCSTGTFGGSFTLRYETSGGYHHMLGATTSSGPYIGDAGNLLLRIFYRDGFTTHTIYTRSIPTSGTTSLTLPSGINVPVTAVGNASTTFANGTESCVATVSIT
ncbi:hypothetical protein [Amycolatopsis sp. SID8362]|uniref:hypothetical protein n=1 Tax=Amycolatopsis sp. SID8362 TaxID=2690346 RepID=UPI0013693E8F|nr:hypothetical protein [Amycolatopsis sp. SID8362]NBH10220.1 hypothetical protein [Amycolatopsis sp. SID8362]NED46915.1 hypothetical protein [Amycolatopsis sp. SID8362]